MQGNNYQIDKEKLFNIPIKSDDSAQQHFIKIVDKILVKNEIGEDTTKLKRGIDQMAYELYELTGEKKAVIE